MSTSMQCKCHIISVQIDLLRKAPPVCNVTEQVEQKKKKTKTGQGQSPGEEQVRDKLLNKELRISLGAQLNEM